MKKEYYVTRTVEQSAYVQAENPDEALDIAEESSTVWYDDYTYDYQVECMDDEDTQEEETGT